MEERNRHMNHRRKACFCSPRNQIRAKGFKELSYSVHKMSLTNNSSSFHFQALPCFSYMAVNSTYSAAQLSWYSEHERFGGLMKRNYNKVTVIQNELYLDNTLADLHVGEVMKLQRLWHRDHYSER